MSSLAALVAAIGIATNASAAGASCPLSLAVSPYASTPLARWDVGIADGSDADLDGAADGSCEATLRVCVGETGRCPVEPVGSVHVRVPGAHARRALREALAAMPGASAAGDGVRFADGVAPSDACVEAQVRVPRRQRRRVRLVAAPAARPRQTVRIGLRCRPSDAAEPVSCRAVAGECPRRAGDGRQLARPADDLTTLATVAASSARTGASGAVDGIVPAAAGDASHEWVPQGEGAGALLRLTWPEPVRLSHVVLYDRPSRLQNVLGATLLVDDEPAVLVGALPPDGGPATVSLDGRTLTSLAFVVSAVQGEAAGLAEIAAFGTRERDETPQPPPGHPRVFLTEAGVARVREKVAARAQPWTAAFAALMAQADAALDVAPRSVTAGGRHAGSHDYWTDPPYARKDGVVDPGADRTDYEAAMAVSRAVRDLGLAHAITGVPRYADKALELLRAWALAPATRMRPRFTNEQSRIELSTTMPALVYGADLVWNHPGWTVDERAGFEAWLRALVADARAWSAKQNFENWRHVLIATGAAFLDDGDAMHYAFDRFRAVLPDQMSPRGELVRERDRSRSLFYATFALSAMLQTAEVARLRGVDLHGWTAPSGQGLATALAFHVPYVVEPSTWPHQQITAYEGDNAALYELAASHWPDPALRRPIDAWRRPMVEERVMGPVTLTHGDGLQARASVPR